jgi:hypothetical protein
LAWLKLQWFCHAGDTEVGGFGISATNNPLYTEEFVTIPQRTTAVTVRFEDTAVADYFDACVDRGLKPDRFARIWLHTHPGKSAEPSHTDEVTFVRSFGACDWSVMAILSRTGQTYARLAFAAGPGAQIDLPVAVHWADWPYQAVQLHTLIDAWKREYAAHVSPIPLQRPLNPPKVESIAPRDPAWWQVEPWHENLDVSHYEPTNAEEAYGPFL